MAALGCGSESAASEGEHRAAACVMGAIGVDSAVARTVAGTLAGGACPRANGVRYADFTVHLAGGRAYLVRAAGRRDTTSRRHHEYDVALLTAEARPRELLAGTPFDARDPSRSLSQLFFIAPADSTYAIRVSGRAARDRGAFALSVRRCGGGTLGLGRAMRGVLGPASCLEQMSFGADSGYADLWRIHLSPRQKVRVRVTTSARVPLYVQMRGPGLSGDERDGDVGRLTFTARQGGDYTVLVGQTAYDSLPHAYGIRADEPRY